MAKTKALISFAVTVKLICFFVFAYAKKRFCHDEAQILVIAVFVSINPCFNKAAHMQLSFNIYRADNAQLDLH